MQSNQSWEPVEDSAKPKRSIWRAGEATLGGQGSQCGDLGRRLGEAAGNYFGRGPRRRIVGESKGIGATLGRPRASLGGSRNERRTPFGSRSSRTRRGAAGQDWPGHQPGQLVQEKRRTLADAKRTRRPHLTTAPAKKHFPTCQVRTPLCCAYLGN